MTFGRPRSIALVAATLLAGCLALGTLADQNELHADGMKALAQGRYAEAETAFRQAIAEDAEENSGRFFRSVYVPHYFLGVALAEQGRCAEAIDSWRESKRQGKVEKTDYGSLIDQRISGCETQLTAVRLAKVGAEQALEKARTGARRVDGLASKQELSRVWGEGDPSLEARQRQAAAQVAEAEALLERGAQSGDEETLRRAGETAQAATNMLITVEEEARERLGLINAAAAEAMAALSDAEDAAERLLDSVAPLAPYPPQLGAQAQTLKNLLADVERTRDAARAAEIEEATAQIVRETRALRRLAGSPPRALRDAAEAFLSGDAEQTLSLLAEAKLNNDRSRWHARMLQGAARYHLFVVGGEEDRALYDAAVGDVRAAFELGGQHGRPSERFFSPRFLELVGSTRAAYESGAGQLSSSEPSSSEPSGADGG